MVVRPAAGPTLRPDALYSAVAIRPRPGLYAGRFAVMALPLLGRKSTGLVVRCSEAFMVRISGAPFLLAIIRHES